MIQIKPEDGQLARRKLPIGIQTFRRIREENCYYIDKTAYMGRLVAEGTHYFLSRPRRFGKSLFLDTLKELFEGNEPLFEGLAIHEQWDWSVRHPVLRLDFSRGNFKEPGRLQEDVMAQLDAVERREGVGSDYTGASVRFSHLLEALHERSGQRVVVLVDEYDKPILDALETPEVARANRDYLHGLYSTIKFGDAHIKFSFLTGVSKFSKVSLFSGLNNLIDITLDPQYSAICGYTEADLDAVFAPELVGLDREEIRRWYNGYNWLGAEQVYNPFDVLLLFRRRAFAAYWFETGTPTFLLETLLARGVSALALDDMLGSDELLSAFDVDHIAPEALLFQTGYLTIRRTEQRGGEHVLPTGLPQPGGAAEPERELAQPSDGQSGAPGGAQCPAVRSAIGQRLRQLENAVRGILCQHSVPVAHQQRDRQLRGLLRQRVLLVFCVVGAVDYGGGQQPSGSLGHGSGVQ